MPHAANYTTQTGGILYIFLSVIYCQRASGTHPPPTTRTHPRSAARLVYRPTRIRVASHWQLSSTPPAYRSYVSTAYCSYVSIARCSFGLPAYVRTHCTRLAAIIHVNRVPLLLIHRLLLVCFHRPLLVRIHGPLPVRFPGLRKYAL
jgi:hypothetical protein